jgi:hypothetical protein
LLAQVLNSPIKILIGIFNLREQLRLATTMPIATMPIVIDGAKHHTQNRKEMR